MQYVVMNTFNATKSVLLCFLMRNNGILIMSWYQKANDTHYRFYYFILNINARSDDISFQNNGIK